MKIKIELASGKEFEAWQILAVCGDSEGIFEDDTEKEYALLPWEVEGLRAIRAAWDDFESEEARCDFENWPEEEKDDYFQWVAIHRAHELLGISNVSDDPDMPF